MHVKVYHLINRLVYFVLPNTRFLFSGRIKMRSGFPECEQILRLTGNGLVELGINCHFGYKLGGFNKGAGIEIQPRYATSIVNIGDRVFTNNNIFICAANKIVINADTLIGQNVTMIDHEAHGLSPSDRRKIGSIGEIIIGKNVWIGNNVIILKNTVIGDNSIIAAGAVVSGNYPENVIIGGVPGKVIKTIQ